MTGYHDYLIVLSPAENIVQRVKRLKDFSAGVIGEYESRFSKAHISVQYWPRKKPVWIEPLIPKLERDLQKLSPLVLDINGFNYFDHPERPTIYAKLVSTPLTDVWFKQLRRYFSKPNFEPHITIAQNVPTKAFNKLWPHFKTLAWNEQISFDKLTILRREMIGHEKNYKVFKEIYFNSRFDFNAFANSKLKAPAKPLDTADTQQIQLF